VVQPTVEQPKRAAPPWHHLVFGRDTDLRVARMLVEGIRCQSFAAREESVRAINSLVGQIALAGARARLPGAPAAMLAQEVDRRRHSAAIAAACSLRTMKRTAENCMDRLPRKESEVASAASGW
jgi:hypothetical protein